MPLTSALKKLAEGENLSSDETQVAFDEIFYGKVSNKVLGTFLLSLRKKSETAEELLGAARSMREHMVSLPSPDGTIDLVGTGGDNYGTFNISTAAAIVVSACGVPVAKHGNRGASSLSGSSDVLEALGVNLEPELPILERCLNEIGLVFLFAPRHHPAMRHVAEVRRSLGVRTIFNLLGPLTNPANVKYLSIGVYDSKTLAVMAEALKALGSKCAWFAHGHDGLDEISTTGSTKVIELSKGRTRNFTLSPEDFALPRAKLHDLKGGNAVANAKALREVLKGSHTPFRDIVLANAAAALVIAGKANNLKDGTTEAASAIDSGKANKKLDQLIKMTS